MGHLAALVWPALAFTFASWAVALGGLSSLQHRCSDGITAGQLPTGLQPSLDCKQVYRFYWFIIALQFFLVCGLVLSLIAGWYKTTRISWLGIAAVLAILYIYWTDTFLAAKDSVFYNSSNRYKHTANTMIAGGIMMAIANLLLVIILGLKPASEKHGAHHRTARDMEMGVSKA